MFVSIAFPPLFQRYSREFNVSGIVLKQLSLDAQLFEISLKLERVWRTIIFTFCSWHVQELLFCVQQNTVRVHRTDQPAIYFLESRNGTTDINCPFLHAVTSAGTYIYHWAVTVKCWRHLKENFYTVTYTVRGPGSSVGIATELRAGRSGVRLPVGTRFSARPDWPCDPPSLLYNGYRVSPGGVKCGRGVLLTTHHLIVPRSWKSRAISVPTLWATPGL